MYRVNANDSNLDTVIVHTAWFRAKAVAAVLEAEGVPVSIRSSSELTMHVEPNNIDNALHKVNSKLTFGIMSHVNISEADRIAAKKKSQEEEKLKLANEKRAASQKELTNAIYDVFKNSWYSKTLKVSGYEFYIIDRSGSPIPFKLRNIAVSNLYCNGMTPGNKENSFFYECYDKARDHYIKLQNF